MTARISVLTEEFGHVVAPHGLLDAELVDATTDRVLALDTGVHAVVIDLRDVVLTSPRALAHLVDRLERDVRGGRISIVCDRLSGRRLLRNRCRSAAFPIVTDLRQAVAGLQSRVTPG